MWLYLVTIICKRIGNYSVGVLIFRNIKMYESTKKKILLYVCLWDVYSVKTKFFSLSCYIIMMMMMYFVKKKKKASFLKRDWSLFVFVVFLLRQYSWGHFLFSCRLFSHKLSRIYINIYIYIIRRSGLLLMVHFPFCFLQQLFLT